MVAEPTGWIRLGFATNSAQRTPRKPGSGKSRSISWSFHKYRSGRRTGRQFGHADLQRNRARRLIGVIDAGDDPVELCGLKGPREHELAGLLRDSPLLHFRSHGTQHLEIIAFERR